MKSLHSRFRVVQSKQNARLKQLRRALAQPPRDSGNVSHDPASRDSLCLAGIEGPNLLDEALRAGLPVPCIFVAQGSEVQLENLPLPQETEILLLPRELLNSALTTETPQSVAALIEPPHWGWEHLFTNDKITTGKKTPPLILILAGLQDPGNLGTILRSAEAFGTTGVLSLPGTVSAWNPKAVRASAGSVFRVPLVATSAEECFTRLREAGVRVWTTALRDAEAANQTRLTEPTALLIGNEGNGVPELLAAQADAAITIPCPGPVESLNASVAASVLLYEASRQRSEQNEPHKPALKAKTGGTR